LVESFKLIPRPFDPHLKWALELQRLAYFEKLLKTPKFDTMKKKIGSLGLIFPPPLLVYNLHSLLHTVLQHFKNAQSTLHYHTQKNAKYICP
jgi:hypothetical protein